MNDKSSSPAGDTGTKKDEHGHGHSETDGEGHALQDPCLQNPGGERSAAKPDGGAHGSQYRGAISLSRANGGSAAVARTSRTAPGQAASNHAVRNKKNKKNQQT